MVKLLDVHSALWAEGCAGSVPTSGSSGWPAGAPPCFMLVSPVGGFVLAQPRAFPYRFGVRSICSSGRALLRIFTCSVGISSVACRALYPSPSLGQTQCFCAVL